MFDAFVTAKDTKILSPPRMNTPEAYKDTPLSTRLGGEGKGEGASFRSCFETLKKAK
jgi:hypothetical protein